MNLEALYKVKEVQSKRLFTLGFYLYEMLSVTNSIVIEISGFWGLGERIIGGECK